MRLNSQLMRSRTSRPLHCALVIDLSHLNLVSVERLELCPKLQTLNVRGNRIESVPNLDCCRHLWKIDLANNKLRSLEGLCRFPAFGTLILSNNDLDWNELQKIRRMHILDLSLHGNPMLEMDAYYRLHVIDSLPNVWMLDGRIITSAERNQVKQFFKDSALSDRPVRHKLPKSQFVPTSLKNIAITGVHGCRTDHLMRNFPNKTTINIDIDKRRLLYLAYNLQQDVNLEIKNKKSDKVKPSKIIEYLISCRKNDQERCNMVLLLLVGSLEFSIPLSLVQQTLEVARLSNIEEIQTIDLFMFSRETRCRVVSLLLSAVKIERDQSIDGGLYNRLYLALYDLVADIIKLANGDDVERYQAVRKKMDSRKSGYRSLLASEIVQLLCIVPAFFDFIGKDPGVMDLISIATKHSDIGEKIKALSWKIQAEGGDISQVYQTVSQFLLDKTKQANAVTQSGKGLVQVISPKQESDNNIEPSYIITSKRILKTDRPKSCVPSSQADKQSSPQRIPRAATAVGLRNVANTKTGLVRAKTARRKPRLGDRVQLGHQACGRLVALPENHVGLVQLDTVAASRYQQADHQMHSKFDNQFHYVNFKLMEWDYRNGKWRIVSGVFRNQSMLPASHKKSSVGSREDAKFLSEALQQTLKLRVDLPLENKTQIRDGEQDGPKALITDHVRSIVKECLEEAEVCWADDKPEIPVEENWNEPERTESPGPQSEVTVQIDSESLNSGKQEIVESEEPISEDHDILDDRSHNPIPKATPMLTPHMIQMYQLNAAPMQQWQQDYQEELVSYTENERLNAWCSSEAMQLGSSTGLPSRVGSATFKPSKSNDPPPQRPSSPAHTVAIKQGNSWLAGGRDVSIASSVRHLPSHIPGWMEELETSRRPKSCSGTRQHNKPVPGHASWSHFSRPFTATRGNDDVIIEELTFSTILGNPVHHTLIFNSLGWEKSATHSITHFPVNNGKPQECYNAASCITVIIQQ